MLTSKYFLLALIIYIPYTFLWFLWHNNLFPNLYYENLNLLTPVEQNIWFINLANSFLCYGMVFFYFHINKKITLFSSIIYCVFYNLSVIGFFNFMLLGAFNISNNFFIFFDFLWAIFIGIFSAVLLFYFYNIKYFFSSKL